MAFYDYHFVTHWKVKGPIQVVYNILKNGPGYAQWWKPAYVRSDESGPQKVTSLVRAKLPYTLTFTTELIRENFPHDFEIKATGELVGTGLWKFRQEDAETLVDFYWDVQVAKPLVRWLSLFLKPLFKWNHDWVMTMGEKGLQEEISIFKNNYPMKSMSSLPNS